MLLMAQQPLKNKVKKGTVKITFKNVVKGEQLALHDVDYTNVFKEVYTVTKFKYYIGHTTLNTNVSTARSADQDIYHLIDQSKPESLSFSFDVAVNKYNSISFQIGVDSIHNVSGAQTGALDVINDMFWTWNSGYVMFKFEGNSPASTQVNNKIEYHVGGYSGENKTMRNITLALPQNTLIDIRAGKTSEIIIEADIDKWWQQPYDIRITDNAVSMTPGPLAKRMADNYAKLFTVKAVENN